MSIPVVAENEEFCTDMFLLCAARVKIENFFIESTYRSARVGIGSLPSDRQAVGISIDVEVELDDSTKEKIKAILENKFRVNYWTGRNSRTFLMKEAADTTEAGNRNMKTTVGTDPNAYWRTVKSGSQIVGGTMSMMLRWNNNSNCEDYPSTTVSLMTAAHVLNREFNCTFYERPQFRTHGTKSFCDLTFLDIGDVSDGVVKDFNTVPDLDIIGRQIVLAKSITDELAERYKNSNLAYDDQLRVFLTGKYVFLNGRLNQSKAIIDDLLPELGSKIIDLYFRSPHKAEVGDSGGLIYDKNGVAIAVLKSVSDDGSMGHATLLTELLSNFEVPRV